jgi:hypothetical protein
LCLCVCVFVFVWAHMRARVGAKVCEERQGVSVQMEMAVGMAECVRESEGGWVGRWVCRWVGGLVDGCRWMDVCTNDWTDVWVGELGVEDGGWLTECPLCEIGGLSLCPL